MTLRNAGCPEFPTRGNRFSHTWKMVFLRVGIAHASLCIHKSYRNGCLSSLNMTGIVEGNSSLAVASKRRCSNHRKWRI